MNPINNYKYGFKSPENYTFKSEKGLNKKVVQEISYLKREPSWMLQFRMKALEIFLAKPMPTWGADLTGINFEDIYYYLRPTDNKGKSWSDIPREIKNTYDKLGIPEAEKNFLAGVSAQWDSEVVYSSLREELKKKGVIFTDTDTALKEHPEIFKEYFSKIVPPGDNKFAALNSAVWSGGSFVYVPSGVKVGIPLQAYFRINAQNMGQFERTLIIAEEGSAVHYVEGCSAPIYTDGYSLHAAVVEIIVKKGARVQYTTIQNWYKNVYNLVTKRAFSYEDSEMYWLDCNLGSKVTMKYPSIFLKGKGAKGEILSLAYASEGQHQDAGGKIIHLAPYTTSNVVSKSVSLNGGRTSYRGLLRVIPGAENVKSTVRCDALILDQYSRADTYPTMKIEEEKVNIGHEATVSKIGEEQLFYLRSRGLTENQAASMIVNGFIEPIVSQLPLEYAVEMNRLVSLEMSGSVG